MFYDQADTICAVFEQFGFQKQGLVFSVEAGARPPHGSLFDDGSDSHRVVVQFCLEPWKHLWARTLRFDHTAAIEDVTEYKFLSSHDSEWKSALRNYLSQVYFQLTESEGFAPRACDTSCRPYWFRNFVTPVDVVWERNPEDRYGYGKKLVSIKTKDMK